MGIISDKAARDAAEFPPGTNFYSGATLAGNAKPAASSALAHSKLPPSSAARWATCTASIGFIAENKHLLPEQDWTLADEGSRAHDAAKSLLNGTPVEKVTFDNEEMKRHVLAYVTFCRNLTQPGDRILTETKVPLFYLPSERGTVDRAHINMTTPRKSVYIADLKYGVGVSVEAKENKQLAIYAESLIRQQEEIEDIPDDTTVTLAIFQPRDRNNPEPVRLWAITRKILREFTCEIELAADKVLNRVVGENSRTEFVAGPHCDKSFCPARGICKAYAHQGLVAVDDEAPVDVVIETKLAPLPALPTITRAQRQRILAAKAAMIAWLEQIENQEVAELMAGAAPDKFKLVEGKSNRQWADEDKAAKLLLDHLKHDEIYPPIPAEILSPAQAEKLLKAGSIKLDLSAVITKPAGKPTLVPVTDKRSALNFTPTAGLTHADTPQDLI